MPIYEFYCPDNRKIYSFLARSLSYAGRTPRCPDNPEWKMERMISSFAVIGRAKEKSELPPGADVDDPKMEAAMADMEREMASMSEDNPDPRQLASMLRKMSSLAGPSVPGEMEEVIRRLECGEDPDKLDAEFGDVFDQFESSSEPLEGNSSGEGGKLHARLQRLRRPRVTRDPQLYEISEFLD